MDDEILKLNRHNGMRKVFEANYGSDKSADKIIDEKQAEEEAAEAEMGTD